MITMEQAKNAARHRLPVLYQSKCDSVGDYWSDGYIITAVGHRYNNKGEAEEFVSLVSSSSTVHYASLHQCKIK